MKNVNLEVMERVSVEQYMAACNEAEKYKKLYQQAATGQAAATARYKLEREDSGYHSYLLMWITKNALEARTIAELKSCKARYEALHMECYRISEARKEKHRYIRANVNGERRKIKILQ